MGHFRKNVNYNLTDSAEFSRRYCLIIIILVATSVAFLSYYEVPFVLYHEVSFLLRKEVLLKEYFLHDFNIDILKNCL